MKRILPKPKINVPKNHQLKYFDGDYYLLPNEEIKRFEIFVIDSLGNNSHNWIAFTDSFSQYMVKEDLPHLEKAKLKFFAQYFGQCVMKPQKINKDSREVWANDLYGDDYFEELPPCLDLRMPEDVKDDEIVEFCRIAGFLSTATVEEYRQEYYDLIGDNMDEVTHEQFDYLKSIGVAVPFLYIENGVTRVYPVDLMIEDGWIKPPGRIDTGKYYNYTFL